MSEEEFDTYFDRSQQWLAKYGRAGDEESLDITRTYVKQQQLADFSVHPRAETP